MAEAGQSGSKKHNKAVRKLKKLAALACNSYDTSDSYLSNLPYTALREQGVIEQNMNTEPFQRSFHLGGTKYLTLNGPKGVEKIHLQEWGNGKVTNEGIKLNAPKIVVILNYIAFVRQAIKKTLNGNRNVLCQYHIGSGFLVSCNSSYKTISIRLWKSTLAKTYPTSEGISLDFQEWEEFIKACQKIFIEYQEINSCEPCILDSEDKPGHDATQCQEHFNFESESI